MKTKIITFFFAIVFAFLAIQFNADLNNRDMSATNEKSAILYEVVDSLPFYLTNGDKQEGLIIFLTKENKDTAYLYLDLFLLKLDPCCPEHYAMVQSLLMKKRAEYQFRAEQAEYYQTVNASFDHSLMVLSIIISVLTFIVFLFPNLYWKLLSKL